MNIFVTVMLVGGAGVGAHSLGEKIRNEVGPVVGDIEAVFAMASIIFALRKGLAASEAKGKAYDAKFRARPGALAVSTDDDGSRSGRAFGLEIGKWPKVTHAGMGYLIVAHHESPRREKWPERLGMATAVLGFFVGLPVVVAAADKDKEGWMFLATLFAALAFGWVSKKLIWAHVCGVHLKIRVQNGGATWNGPHGQDRILPNEPFEASYSPSHRLAGQQARVNADKERRNRGNNPVSLPVAYLAASEIVVVTGLHKQHHRVLAEIAYDGMGDMARMLCAAFDMALEQNRKDIEALRVKQRAGRSNPDTDTL